MKKLIYLILVLALGFTSCEPMDDIYNELDKQEATDPRNEIGSDEYTLTSDDYDALGLNYGSFSSESDAKTMLPEFISSVPKYDYWTKNSSVLVGYQLYVGNAFSVEDYKLTQEDYTLSGSDLLGFQSDATPSTYLADILADNISYSSEGDYAIAKYYQYTGIAYTVTPTVSLDENLDYGAVTGDLLTASGGNWVNHSGTDNQLQYTTTSLSMTDYPASAIGGSMMISSSGSEDVNTSITPITSGKVFASTLINISAVSDGTYFFHFMDDSYGYSARVGAKDDGSGNILFGIGATSSTLTYGTTSFDLNTTYLLVSSYDIATGISNLYVLTVAVDTEPNTAEASNTGDANKGIERIGVRQGGGGPTATLDGIRVANTWSAIMSNGVLDNEVIGDKIALEMGYTYADGAWVTPSDRFYSVSDEDFDSMGEDSGEPGRYNNFGSSTPPDDYLPTFLGLKFPYAPEGAELDVVYDYYSSSSGAQLRGNLYTVIDGEWVAYESTISTTLQFGHDGTTWVPDNTIKYTLVGADFEFFGTELEGNTDFSNVNLGNMVTHSNFDYNWSEDQILYALGLLADKLNPGAEEGQKYLFTYLVYDNGVNEHSKILIKQNGAWVVND